MQAGRVIEKKNLVQRRTKEKKTPCHITKANLSLLLICEIIDAVSQANGKAEKKGQSKLKPYFYVKIVNVVKLGSVIVERLINTGFAFSKLSKRRLYSQSYVKS